MPLTLPALILAAVAAAAPAPAQKISFRTPDGWTIAALYLPPGKAGVVVVLAHGVGSSKSEWEALSERLAAAGLGTLAIDLRGHGDSRQGPTGARGYQDFDATGEWPRAVEDLNAAAQWLQARGIPKSRIALGGASIGANLASRAAAAHPQTPFLLLLSPGPDYRDVKLLLNAHLKTLAGASPGDRYAYQTLEPLSSHGVDIFKAPAGHGVQMFSDPAILDQVSAWIATAAKPPVKPKRP